MCSSDLTGFNFIPWGGQKYSIITGIRSLIYYFPFRTLGLDGNKVSIFKAHPVATNRFVNFGLLFVADWVTSMAMQTIKTYILTPPARIAMKHRKLATIINPPMPELKAINATEVEEVDHKDHEEL
mgnify:CR=1 FL=1